MAALTAARAFSRSTSSSGLLRSSRHQFLRSVPRVHLVETPLRSFTAGCKSLEKKYSEDHEWVELSADGSTGTIGISEYAANALGDVVFVELPQVGLEVQQGEAIGAVESVKSASDIMSPIGGKIIEPNFKLEENPEMINKSPEGDAWVAKIQVSNRDEMGKLMDAKAYQEFTSKDE